MNVFRFLAGAALLATVSLAQAGQVRVLSAVVKDKAIADAEVILQKNGEASRRTRTNADGVANLPGSVDTNSGEVTLIVVKPGYSDLVAKCPCDGLTYAMSPVMTDLDGLRIVLQWGSKPLDLDSHLYSFDDHVYFERRKGTRAGLDVDDTDGYGPETITIDRREQGRSYVYAVHNFSDKRVEGGIRLASTSGVKVYVYVGSTLVRTFTPPQGSIGNTWVVFAIGDNGEFYDINRFTDRAAPMEVGRVLATTVSAGNFESAPVLQSDAGSLADQYNREGEREYHAGNMTRAERLYLEAINTNPEHAQAYSNLGLLYQKVGKSAEGLFANRKAISLASGAKRAVIQASSYYNIARIYEDSGDWNSALENYRTALNLREHSAYRKGIARMQQKLGAR